MSTEHIQLNVGGQRYDTTIDTLKAYPGSAIADMFTHPIAVPQDDEGAYFLDRNGHVFAYILDYLRDGTLIAPQDPTTHALLRREVCYYGLPIFEKISPVMAPEPDKYIHARIVVDEMAKHVEYAEGVVPSDLHTRSLYEIVQWFTNQGYKVATEFTSRGSRGYSSIWLVKKMAANKGPVATPVMEVKNSTSTAVPVAGSTAMAAERPSSGSKSGRPPRSSSGGHRPSVRGRSDR